jgi:hypothetical protein
MVDKHMILCYRLLQVYRLLHEDKDNTARKCLTIIQLWELLSTDTLLQRDLDNRGLPVVTLKELRNSIAHLNAVNMDSINRTIDNFLTADILYYLVDAVYPMLDALDSESVRGNYYSIIKNML